MTANNTVFKVVNSLAKSFYCDAKALPAQTDFRPLTASLCFTVLGVDLAIPVEDLTEVQELPNYTRLPRVKPWMMGVANMRGKLVPIIDLAQFLDVETRVVTRLQRLLVVELNGNLIGLIVDQVSGVQHYDTEQFDPAPDSVPEPFAPYIQGCYIESDGTTKLLFRPLQLVEDQSFQNVAQ